jgi:flagellar protein FliO/FliZ
MNPLEIARIAFALLFVLGLIALAAALARKSGLVDATRRTRRLALVETLPLDARRRAAILRCDGRDHLVVLTHDGVAVIESGLRAPEDHAPQTMQDISAPMRRSAKIVAFNRLFQRDLIDETNRLRSAGAI